MGQRTIAEKVSCTGIGLHTGAPVQMTLLPARVGTGVVFARTDLPEAVEIPARCRHVRSTQLATSLGAEGASVGTVEHLLAALYGLGVDNLRVEVDGPELPVMDGSAAPFAYLIRSAGVFDQQVPRPRLRVRRPLEVRRGDGVARIEPFAGFAVRYAVEFSHPAIGRQELEWRAAGAERFERELSTARTFGFLRDVEELRRAGFARGASLENTVVIGESRVLNPEGLRWPDEFVRHKMLDLLGDLALLGVPIQGRVCVSRGGHALHRALVQALQERPAAWRLEPFGDA